MREEQIIRYMRTKKYADGKYVCWDFVRDVYKDEYNIELPEYPVDEIQTEFKDKLTSNIPHKKIQENPQSGDIIVFSLFANQHAGIMIDKCNFIHLATDGVRVTNVKDVGGNYAIYRMD